MADVTPRQALSDALQYWETRRRLYNLALALVVAVVFLANLPASRANLTFPNLARIFALAVLANLAYCAALVVDVALQISAFRLSWLRARWIVLVVAVALVAVAAQLVSHGVFAHQDPLPDICVKDCD